MYVSNFKGAEDPAVLKEHKITHVAAVGEEFVHKEGDGIQYWTKDITDDESAGATMAASLRDGAAFIHSALSADGAVLVHCAAGISRSATVVLGYLILHADYSLRSAFAHLYKCRPCVWPNEGFMAALIALEVEVRGGAPTITTDEYDRWCDWEGPEEEGGTSGGGGPPMGPPRLLRDNTFLDDEQEELDALDEMSEMRKRLGLPKEESSDSVSLDDRIASAAAEPTSPPKRTQGRRFSLTKAERQANAKAATEEAKQAIGDKRRGSSVGGGGGGGGFLLLSFLLNWRRRRKDAAAYAVAEAPAAEAAQGKKKKKKAAKKSAKVAPGSSE